MGPDKEVFRWTHSDILTLNPDCWPTTEVPSLEKLSSGQKHLAKGLLLSGLSEGHTSAGTREQEPKLGQAEQGRVGARVPAQV